MISARNSKLRPKNGAQSHHNPIKSENVVVNSALNRKHLDIFKQLGCVVDVLQLPEDSKKDPLSPAPDKKPARRSTLTPLTSNDPKQSMLQRQAAMPVSRPRTSSLASRVSAPKVAMHAVGRRNAKPSICVAYSKSSSKFLEQVSQQIGWQSVNEERDDSDVHWVVSSEQLNLRLRKIKEHQFCARIPGMNEICNKCRFSNAMFLAQKLFPEIVDFWPKSWVLPSQYKELKSTMKGSRLTFIVKPGDGAKGEGIFIALGYDDLFRRLEDHQKKFNNLDVVVQVYLEQPMLLKGGYKFDLRIYALIQSVSPLRVYVCREGLARLCTLPYKAPSQNNVNQVMGHLTNYSLNKQSDNYVWSKYDQDEAGSKRTISAAFAELKRMGFDVDQIWRRIDRLVHVTFLAVQPMLLASSLQLMQEHGVPRRWGYDGGAGCFHIVGVDVMLDKDGNPYLLELNASPRQAIESILPADEIDVASGEKVCSCEDEDFMHVHRVCEVDKKAKTCAVGGALQIVVQKKGFSASQSNLSDARQVHQREPVTFVATFMGQKPRNTQLQSLPQKPGKSLPHVSSLSRCYVMVSGRKHALMNGSHSDETESLLDDDPLDSFFARADTSTDYPVKDERGIDPDMEDLESRFSIVREIFQIYDKLITNKFKLDGNQMRRMARNCEGSKGVLSRGEVDVLFNKALAMAEGHDFKGCTTLDYSSMAWYLLELGVLVYPMDPPLQALRRVLAANNKLTSLSTIEAPVII